MIAFGMNMLLLAQDKTANAVAQATESTVSAAEQTASSGLPQWASLLIILALIVLPFIVANGLAAVLKVKEMALRMGVILFSLTLFSMPFFQQIMAGKPITDAIDLGIDLAGGTNMVLEVDRDEAALLGKEINKDLMERMKTAIERRVSPTGTEEVTVRVVGTDRIEIIIPSADAEKTARTKRRVFDLGQLEFHLLANDIDHAAVVQAGLAVPNNVDEVKDSAGRKIGMWRPTALDAEGNPKTSASPEDRVHSREVEREGKTVTQWLIAVDPDPNRYITGRLLKSVRETISENAGLAVGFTLNERGGFLMNILTSNHQPKEGAGYKSRLAILLNNEIHSAPTINGVISTDGVIEGRFTQEEIDELIGVLNAGALEVPLKPQPVNEFTISPLLGADVQRKGLNSMVISLVAVLVVVLVYYLKAGFVADVCLVMNFILLVGAMSIIDATFTLPGLAGVVLTIGMAVDANVLIFERMREEQAKGSSLRMAIKNGFEKAFSSIFDSNVTTLITAAILYYIGTDQVKGFAVSLFVGICISMFTALYVGRLLFDLAEKKKWLTDLKMMSVIPTANIDFVGQTRLCMFLSAVMIAVGMIAVGVRGRDNLDIDFRGGSMVSFQFREGDQAPSIDEVRARLSESFQEAISLESLQVPHQGGTHLLYRMRTVDPAAEQVRDHIKAAFADTPYKLILQEVTLGDVTPIAASTTPPADAATPADPFQGGHLAAISLKQGMSAAALTDELHDVLQNLPAKYADVSRLAVAEAVDPAVIATPTHELRIKFAAPVPLADVNTAMTTLSAKLDGQPHFEEINTFDSSVAGETQVAALNAIMLSLVAIVAYLWIRFQKVTFGIAACVALVHDVAITIGIMALASFLSGNPVGSLLGLTDFKFNLTIVAAVLTVIGYSLNDTIVVFDRVREVRGRNPALTNQMINLSLNQTLSRTLLTSVTTLIVLIVLYFMGGEGIHGFSFCLIVGILIGTYSSIYVAAPVLVWLHNRRNAASRAMTA